MALTLTQAKIDALINEPKPLPADYRDRVETKQKRGHRERELTIIGRLGSEFRLILRESSQNALDFSVILAYQIPGTNQVFRLRRYNGKSHEHTNKLEGEKFYDFHRHEATERYQATGFREDTYATRPVPYSDFQGALECLFDECNFERPEGDDLPLFASKG